MASRLFTVDLDLGLNKAKRFTFEDFSTNPDSDLAAGRIVYFTGSGSDQNHFRVYDGTNWNTIAFTTDAPDLTGVVFETDTQTLTNKTYEDAILKDRISFTNNSDVETMYIEHSYTGTNRIVSTDDISIRSTGGDVILYPGNDDGGTGKAYVHWGNDATAAGIQNEITTAGNTQNLTNKTIEDAVLKDTISFTDNSDVERMYLEYSGTGATRLVSADDLSIRSQNGDIILYPGSNNQWGGDGGTGRAYVGWGNDDTDAGLGNEILTRDADQILTNKTFNDYLGFTNPSTAPVDGEIGINDANENFEVTALVANLVLGASAATKSVVISGNAGEFLNDATVAGNQIATIGDISGLTATISAGQFIASRINDNAMSWGGYSFTGDGGSDSGMFSESDGVVKFVANAELVAQFNTTAFTVEKDLIVTGDLTVNGTLTTLNTESVVIEDNILLLNSNMEGIPSLNAGLEVLRGDYTNTSLYWKESSNRWFVDVVEDDDSTAVPTGISLDGHTHVHTDITDFTDAVEDHIDNYISTIETALVTDGFTKKYTALNPSITVAGGEATWTVSHALGTADVIVQFRNATTNKVVEADIEIGATTAVIKWNSASNITAEAYKVVVIG